MREFKKCNDKFRIDWEKRECNCEVGVYLYDREHEIDCRLCINLCREIDRIEDVLEKREEIRKQLEKDDLTGLLELQSQSAERDIADFFTGCAKLGHDISQEIAFITKSGQLAKWIERASGSVSSYQAELDQIKEGTEKYQRQAEYLAQKKEMASILLGLKSEEKK